MSQQILPDLKVEHQFLSTGYSNIISSSSSGSSIYKSNVPLLTLPRKCPCFTEYYPCLPFFSSQSKV